MPKKSAKSISIIGGADGPTSVFIAGKNKKSLKQKVHKFLYEKRKSRIIKKLKAEPHSLDEVIEYAKCKYGCLEISKENSRYEEEYTQLRAATIMQYEPELLGEYSLPSQLKSHEQADIVEFIHQQEQRQKMAEEVPVEKFDIDLHILEWKEDKMDVSIIIEKRYGYIGGGASGDKKQMKEFKKMYRDIWLYYGVEQADIEHRTRRYKDFVGALLW